MFIVNTIKQEISNLKKKKDKARKAYNEIDELKEQISELEEIVNYFKELWKRFIKFYNDKFFNTNDYDEIIHGKEKDDFEI